MRREWENYEESASHMSCSRNHGPRMLVRTSQGEAFCLECFIDLIASPTSLVLHRERELRAFSESLTDSDFCADLAQKRPEFLAGPLADSIFFADDEGLARVLIDVIVTVCNNLAVDDTLLQEAMQQICLHLSRSETTISWKRGHLYSVHALGLLLELHCHHSSHIPSAITSHAGCLQNFLKSIALPTYEMAVDIFFIFAKLTSLEGGIQLIAEYCPALVHLAVHALEKVQSDDFRTHSLDLLIALAQASVFNILLSRSAFEGQHETADQDELVPPGQTGASFVGKFAEAMKASLLSTDTHVQIRSLLLIYQVCPTSLDIDEELHYLVDEGLTDYIFEVLRVSGDLGAVGTSAIQALTTLSLASLPFSDHFSLGLEPLLRVLEHSFTSAFGDLQKDTLMILAAGIRDRPGVLTCTHAEHLIKLLKKSFHRYSSIVKDHRISEVLGFGLSPEGLNGTCDTLITLLRAPSCCNIPSICPMIQDCVSSLIDCISADPVYAIQHRGLISTANLLQEGHLFCVQRNFSHEHFSELALFLMTSFHLGMLPVVTATWESISDEDTMNALFVTVQKIVQDGDEISAAEFARTLISKNWVRIAFESMSKFLSEHLKHNVYNAIGTLINRTSHENLIQDDILHHLPADVEDLLILLEQRSHEDWHLIVAHRAIIALFFTTIEHGDRLVESKLLLSSLEQHLLVNASSSLLGSSPSSTVLKQFFLLFIEEQENIVMQGLFCSMKAENIMIDILQAAYITGSFDFELPLPALKWILKKETLSTISKEFLLKSLDAGAEAQTTIAQLIHEDDDVTELLMSLFRDVVERHVTDEIRIVATGLSSIIRGSRSFAKKFHGLGIVSTLRRFILLQGSKAPGATVTSCVELLCQVLVVLEESMAVMDEGAWLDITSQTEKLLLLQLDNGSKVRTSGVRLFNLLGLIMHKSMRVPTLQEAARKVYMSKELRDTIERNIVNASQKGSALISVDADSEDGVSLKISLLFHALWLRSVCKVPVEEMNDRIEHGFSMDSSTKVSSRISYLHLCQLICFSKHSTQILASSCLVEHLLHTTDFNRKVGGNLAESSVNHLRSVALILQGAALESAGLLRKNACICMMRLVASTVLGKKQKEAITRRPWYKTATEELLLSLAHVDDRVRENDGIHYSASVLSVILSISPPCKWFPSVFNSLALKAAVDSFKNTQYVTAGTVDFFLELLKLGFLDRQQVEALRDLNQAVRRKCYRGRPTNLEVGGTLTSGGNCQSLMDCTPICEGESGNVDSTALIKHLVLNDTREHFFGLCDELNCESLLLVKIDEFLQLSA